MEKPEIGMVVCNCKYQHLKIVEIEDDGDMVILENGFRCSFEYCCDPVPHPQWEHSNAKEE